MNDKALHPSPHPSPARGEGDYNRLRWRCRRGLLELDVILKNFLDRNYAGLQEAERHDFERLLETADNDLLAILSGDEKPTDPLLVPLVNVIRQSTYA